MATNQADRVSQASEQRYRHLFEHLPICIFVADLTVTPALILETNRRAELVYGYTASALVGKPAAQLVPEDVMPTVLTILQWVQQGETVTTETTNQRRDGTRFPVRVVATLDPSDSGRMITAVEDITAERQRRSEAEAIDAERRRIAHEIHDGVAQNLAGLRFKSALWYHQADAASPTMRAALDELQNVLTAAIADIRQSMPELPRVEPLTESEMVILRLVARGLENQHIAQALNYSVYTVANRLRSIYEKLHVANRTQAALYALRQGWATLDEPSA